MNNPAEQIETLRRFAEEELKNHINAHKGITNRLSKPRPRI